MLYKYKNYNLTYNLGGDSQGFPVFINYGLIGDIDLSGLNELALKKGLKLIILERPGYGDSDFIEMQSYDDWSDIVGGFLDSLKVNDFAVIGISAGAPYAYAIANKFTNSTKGVYIISGLPYLLDEAVFDKYGDKKDFYKKIWNYSLEEIADEMRAVLKKYTNYFFRLILPKNIKRELNTSLSNNGSGMAQSVKLQMTDWGFDVYSIPIVINCWHSKKDKEVPFDAVQVMTNKMKNAQLHVKGAGHLPSKKIMVDVFEKIKQDLG